MDKDSIRIPSTVSNKSTDETCGNCTHGIEHFLIQPVPIGNFCLKKSKINLYAKSFSAL